MRMHWIPLLLVVLLAACAPASSPVAEAGQAPSGEPAAPVAPEPVAAAAEDQADIVDYACRTNADCAVKNVGNCCGYYPACVNVDSPTFPEQVAAQCQREGLSSICGFREIAACQCVDDRCTAAGEAARLD